MILRGVRANDKNAISVSKFRDRVGHGATAERCGQTGHGGGMSEAGAVVHIVSTQNRPGKLLHQIIIFVGALG